MIWILIFSFLTILIFGVILLNRKLLSTTRGFVFQNASQKDNFGLLLETSGTIWSFGSNANGRTGLGTDVGSTLIPTRIGADNDWVGISAGGDFSLFIKTDGTLYSCGSNNDGQTGQGTTVGDTLTPTQIGSATDWAGVSAGVDNSFLIKNNGTIYAFGRNDNGRTGLGTDTGATLTPTQIGSDTDWTGVSARSAHSLFLKTDGTIYACGINADGRTGQGTTVGDTLTPTQIGSATDWAGISAGNAHSLFLKTDGRIYTCGANTNGATGQGTTSGSELTPTQIGSDTDWAGISAGDSFSLFIKTDGTIYACGNNASGRTGLGTDTGNALTPTQIGSDTDWAGISAGQLNSLFIKTDASVWSCGSNFVGSTGQNTDIGNLLVPTLIEEFAPN